MEQYEAQHCIPLFPADFYLRPGTETKKATLLCSFPEMGNLTVYFRFTAYGQR